MTRRISHLMLLAAMLAAPALASGAEGAKAEDASGDAAKAKPAEMTEKIRPVSGNVFLKQSRVEISPTIGLSLGDAFFQKYSFGLKLDYHLSEAISFGVHGGYFLDTPSGAVAVCSKTECRNPQMEDLNDVPGRVNLMAGAEVAWSPFYGKTNVMAEKVIHFDTSVILGATLLSYGIPGGESAMGFGGHIGIGQRYFLTRSMTLRAELRDYIYSAQIVTLGDTNTKIENQLMFELGFSFFVGEPPQS